MYPCDSSGTLALAPAFRRARRTRASFTAMQLFRGVLPQSSGRFTLTFPLSRSIVMSAWLPGVATAAFKTLRPAPSTAATSAPSSISLRATRSDPC